jgi:hypothetical protein
VQTVPSMSELFPWTRVDGYQKPYPLPRRFMRPRADVAAAVAVTEAATLAASAGGDGSGGDGPPPSLSARLRTPDSALKPASARARPHSRPQPPLPSASAAPPQPVASEPAAAALGTVNPASTNWCDGHSSTLIAKPPPPPPAAAPTAPTPPPYDQDTVRGAQHATRSMALPVRPVRRADTRPVPAPCRCSVSK